MKLQRQDLKFSSCMWKFFCKASVVMTILTESAWNKILLTNMHNQYDTYRPTIAYIPGLRLTLKLCDKKYIYLLSSCFPNNLLSTESSKNPLE